MAKLSKNVDWRGKAVNFCKGCSNACRYCYVTNMGCNFRWATLDDRNTMVVRQKDVNKKHKNYGCQVMFPSSHDITPQVIDPAMKVLHNLIDAGNERILIVTKPQIHCIIPLCKEFSEHKDKIVFRFTIGSLNNEILSYWEPGASKAEERLQCLMYAHEKGFQTSISMEPMLDHDNIGAIIQTLRPYVNHSIWLGIMSPKLYFLKNNLGEEFNNALKAIYEKETPEKLFDIYHLYVGDPLIKLTASIYDKLKIERNRPEFLL
jgi:DNA repair photolyase